MSKRTTPRWRPSPGRPALQSIRAARALAFEEVYGRPTRPPRIIPHVRYSDLIAVIGPALMSEGRRRAALDGGTIERPTAILADWAGVSRREVHRWARDNRINVKYLDVIATSVHRHPSDLFGELYEHPRYAA